MNVVTMLEALIPLCGGAYGTLLGYRVIGRPTSDPRKLAILDRLKWLGPLVVAFGLWHLLELRHTTSFLACERKQPCPFPWTRSLGSMRLTLKASGSSVG